MSTMARQSFYRRIHIPSNWAIDSKLSPGYFFFLITLYNPSVFWKTELVRLRGMYRWLSVSEQWPGLFSVVFFTLMLIGGIRDSISEDISSFAILILQLLLLMLSGDTLDGSPLSIPRSFEELQVAPITPMFFLWSLTVLGIHHKYLQYY